MTILGRRFYHISRDLSPSHGWNMAKYFRHNVLLAQGAELEWPSSIHRPQAISQRTIDRPNLLLHDIISRQIILFILFPKAWSQCDPTKVYLLATPRFLNHLLHCLNSRHTVRML